jgi:CheY-like chemotaxis protein
MSKPTILCVDDEKIILETLGWQLRSVFGKDYSYEFAENAEEAIDLIEELNEENQEILIIVSDWLMPGQKGDEFLIDVHNRYPNIVKIMLTGQAESDAVERAKEQANLHCCLRKPWDHKDLVTAIQSALKKL